MLTAGYRKPTHTDQYLHWDSNHFITAKNSVYNTLAHRAKVVSSTPEDLHKELEHLNKALKDCQFPTWALNKLQQWFLQKHNHNNNNNNPSEEETNNNSRDSNNGPTNKNFSIVMQGLGEKFKKTCNKQGIQVQLKGTNTVK